MAYCRIKNRILHRSFYTIPNQFFLFGNHASAIIHFELLVFSFKNNDFKSFLAKNSFDGFFKNSIEAFLKASNFSMLKAAAAFLSFCTGSMTINGDISFYLFTNLKTSLPL